MQTHGCAIIRAILKGLPSLLSEALDLSNEYGNHVRYFIRLVVLIS